MKILNYIPRHAFVVFFWCAVFTALICLGSIGAFVVLMPANEHGSRAIATAFRAFSPGVIGALVVALVSYRVLRATKVARR